MSESRARDWLLPAAACAAAGAARQTLLAGAGAAVDPGLDAARLGLLGSVALWSHLGALAFNGPLVDRFGGKRPLLLGALGAAAMTAAGAVGTFAFGAQRAFAVGAVCGAGTAYFQTLILLAALTLAGERERRGLAAGGAFAGLALGETLGLVLAPAAGPAVLLGLALSSALIAWFARELPADEARRTPRLASLWDRRAVLGAAASAVFLAGLARWGLVLFFGAFLAEVLRAPEASAGRVPAAAAACATVAALAAGAWSDAWSPSRRARPAALLILVAALCAATLSRAQAAGPAFVLLCLAVAALYAGHAALSGAFALELGGATACASLILAHHAASAAASPLVHTALERGGWGNWTTPLSGAAMLAALATSALWWAGPAEKEP